MEPLGIEVDRGAGTLTIDWEDGHHSTFPAGYLRWRCPCAECAGEWGRPGRLAGLASLPPDETAIADLHLVGRYALQPVWASGHDSGFYSFEMLRGICPCDACQPGKTEDTLTP